MTRSLVPALVLSLLLAVGCEQNQEVSVDAEVSLSEAARAEITEPSMVIAQIVVDPAEGGQLDLGYEVVGLLCDADDTLPTEPLTVEASWGPCLRGDVYLEALVVPLEGATCSEDASWTRPDDAGASVHLVELDASCGSWTDDVALLIE